MSKKFKKSTLSAKERKEMRRENERKVQGSKTEEEIVFRSKKIGVYMIALLVVAVLVIGVGIAVPSYMACNYMFDARPVAVIKLKAGDKRLTMKYSLYKEECPVMTANFVYLASMGLFDNAVIFDTQNDWIRFGGYLIDEDDEDNYTHKRYYESFMTKLKGDFSSVHYKDANDKENLTEMLQYSVAKTDVQYKWYDFDYALCGNLASSAGSATEFQIRSTAKLQKNNEHETLDYSDIIYRSDEDKTKKTNGKTFYDQDSEYLEPFAVPYASDAETLEAIKYIANMQKSSKRMNEYFLSTATVVTIERVEIYNYEKNWLMKSYENGFESYMNEINGFSSTSDNWSKSLINCTK